MADPAALIALALDAAFGWPGRLYRRIGHPVGAFARFLNMADRIGNRPDHRFAMRRAAGLASMLLLIAITGATAWALNSIALRYLGPYSALAAALLAWPAFAQRSLYAHVRAVATALEHGPLAGARQAVGAICGRDTANLDPHGISRAAIESLAESVSDGVVAPLFWFMVGGLPALWVYKAINTADSMIGHKDARYHAFGWAAARMDDAANLIPARLSAVLICFAGGGGWRIMLRDASNHASPNSGWPEAAMAGALDLRLAGPTSYDGETLPKPWIGDGRSAATAQDIRAALRLYIISLVLMWLITGAILWVR